MKICTKCGIEQEPSQFYVSKKHIDGLYPWCKSCYRLNSKKWRKANPEKVKEQKRRNTTKHPESAQRRRLRWENKNINKVKHINNVLRRKWYVANHEIAIWRAAKARAKKLGIEFSIIPEDIKIPEFCPILGIKLEIGSGRALDNSPSLDRIIPELGYRKDNICVISYRANRIKNDGKPWEFLAILKYLNEHTKDRV